MQRISNDIQTINDDDDNLNMLTRDEDERPSRRGHARIGSINLDINL